MKLLNHVLKITADAVLIACGMLAAACAMPSAFEIPFSRPDMILSCLIAALLLSGWMHLPRGGILPGSVFLIGTIAYSIIRREAIAFGARWIAYAVSSVLSLDFPSIPAYPAPTLPEGADVAYTGTAVTSVLMVFAVVVGLLMAFSLIRGKTSLLTVMIPLPAFLISLIYTDQQPALWTVVLLTVYCAGALLGQGIRRGNGKRLGLFTALLIPTLAVFVALLLVASPERSFTPIPFEQRKQMLGERAEQLGDTMLSVIRRNPKRYDLKDQDDRSEDDTKVFQVCASEAGTYLLRAHSYGQYKSGVWQEVPEYDGEWSPMEALGKSSYGKFIELKIRNSISSERYVPYAFRLWEPIRLRESTVPASSHTSYEWMILPAVKLEASVVSQQERDYVAFAKEQYTLPNGEDKAMLLRIARDAGLASHSDVYRTACEIAAYVRNSGVYTLEPAKAPKGSDFIEYFLTESREGYCVHYASATTALLQAMGIPARYTIGYRAEIPTPDVWIDVTENTAHAWTEVYLAGIGWYPIESTAGFSYDLMNVKDPYAKTYEASTAPTVPPTVPPTPTPTPAPTPEQTTETKDPEATPIPTDDPAALSNETSELTQRPSAFDGEDIITKPGKASGLWWLLLLVPVIPAVWFAVSMLIRTRRMNRFRQKNAKKAVLCMLQYLKKLERFGVTPEPRAQEWEEEALFSNHAMTETRKFLLSKTKRVQDTMYCEAPIKRFIVKWILNKI